MKTLSQPSKPKTETPKRSVSHERMFEIAWNGLLAGAQFYSRDESGVTFYFDSKDELQHLKHLTYLAWNAATYACEMFAEKEELQDFTHKA